MSTLFLEQFDIKNTKNDSAVISGLARFLPRQESCQRKSVVKKRHHRIAQIARKKLFNTRVAAPWRSRYRGSQALSCDFQFLCKDCANFKNLTFPGIYAMGILENANIDRAKILSQLAHLVNTYYYLFFALSHCCESC